MTTAETTEKKSFLAKQVTYPLARLNAKLTAQAARLLKQRSELSLTQWRLMVVIDSKGSASLAEVIRFLDYDKGQMSRVAKDLVSRGLLKATPSKSDQRVSKLSLTADGEAAFRQAAPHMARRRQHLLHALTEEERTQFFSIMVKLADAIDTFEPQL
ncbi:MAG: MarR family transcriptional regulator [Pseudomonadota bacterium]